MTVKADLCLVLPCLGAGHDQSEILGKLWNTRLDCFRQKLRGLDKQSSSFELKYIGTNIIYFQN